MAFPACTSVAARAQHHVLRLAFRATPDAPDEIDIGYGKRPDALIARLAAPDPCGRANDADSACLALLAPAAAEGWGRYNEMDTAERVEVVNASVARAQEGTETLHDLARMPFSDALALRTDPGLGLPSGFFHDEQVRHGVWGFLVNKYRRKQVATIHLMQRPDNTAGFG